VDANIVVPIIIAIVAATPGAVALWLQSKRDAVQVPQSAINEGITASQAAAAIIRQYSDEIQAVRKELHDVRGQIDNLELQLDQKNDEIKRLVGEITQRDRKLAEWAHGIEILCAQVIRLREQPAWRPANTGELKQGG
jgi:peptidoglycan hydrolase CwlO-like protein